MSMSSSSSSYSSYTNSSGSTGSFSSSSSASISSCSTIVAAQPVIRPFGYPDYNYFWIENKSKSNPKLSYFYNYKSHSVVWNRPISKDIPLPSYNTAWAPESPNLSSDDENYVVSDPETKLRRKKRLKEKKRNRQLAFEEQNDVVQVLSIKKNIKNKKMLETLWKLHRFPGETVQDVKKRLFDFPIEKVQVKVEALSDDENDISKISTPVTIKEEPQDDYLLEIEKVNESIKKIEEDSDSDPEHVSYLIKQEYTMNYEKTESENESENEKESNEEIPEALPEEVGDYYDHEEENGEDEESSEEEYYSGEENYHSNKRSMLNKSKNYGIIDNENINESKSENSDDNNYDFNYEAPCLLSEYFEIEIIEDNGENILVDSDNISNDNLEKDNINWSFERSLDATVNSNLTTLKLNPFYSAPKLKRITQNCLVSAKRKMNTSRSKKIQKVAVKTEPVIDDKQEIINEDDGPIICDMYGTRTVNYNPLPNIKLPSWQESTRLSDSSGEDSKYEFQQSKIKQEIMSPEHQRVDECEFQKSKIKQEIFSLEHQSIDTGEIDSSLNKSKEAGALELKNWFPKNINKKRKRMSRKSDSSWCESDLSHSSEFDDFDRTLIRMKKEKKFSSEEKESHSESESDESYTIRTHIKTEANLIAHEPEVNESKNTEESMICNKPVVDLSIVKVERRFSEEEMHNHENFAVEPEKEKASDGSSSDSSSSSSSTCRCSRSSCSCSSSSTSSSEEENNVNEEEAEKKEL